MRGNVEVNKSIFILLLWGISVSILSIESVFGQLSPPLINFSPSEYKGENQIWDITQNQEGDLFFANHDELLQYDGTNWNVLKIDRPTIFRSVHEFGNSILSGGLMDFGIWTKDELGVYQYESLVDKMGINSIDGESFWNVSVFEEYLIFQSLERVIVIDQELKNFQQIDGEFSNNSLIFLEGIPYLIDLQKGLFELFRATKRCYK